MKKIIIEDKKTDTINIKDVSRYAPIFIKRGGKFVGTVIPKNGGWCTYLGEMFPGTWYKDKINLIEWEMAQHSYEFFVEEN